jgi:cell division protease FtsH
MKLDKKIIAKRERELEAASAYLKQEFVGIDDIIDKFINSIKIWYIIPEILTRPVIVNLWGITGVGKTDLVRKFVKAIEFNDRFTEIQMDSREGSTNIEDYLESTFESNEVQGILLLDEIQRFRSIKDNGEENNSNKFQDLWMLLSDGTFQSNAKIKQQLMQMLLEDKFWSERSDDDENDDDDDEPVDKKKKVRKHTFHTSYWEASRLKRLLKLTDSVDEIMKWDEVKKLKVVKDCLNSGETYEGKKYSKLLIVISGNLDEAFTMADQVNDADMDADVYHEYSKSIDIITIKGALKSRFKPEQIARLGNIHIIYPIPSRAAYESIIKQKVESILNHINETNGIKIEVDDSVLKAIYNNGVFPTQGVRPVISTVSSMLENSLPKFIFEYLNSNSKEPIFLKFEDGQLISKIGKKVIKYDVPTVLDDIKESQSDDDKALVSVHEAGHAVLYALLFKTVPTQIVVSTTDEYSDGFVGVHPMVGSKKQLLKDVKVTLGGRIAEELVFGGDYISSGAYGDLYHATQTIGQFIRDYAMDESNLGVFQPLPKNNGTYKVSLEETDVVIETTLKRLYKETEELLRNNMDFLMEVTEELMKKSSLTQQEFKKIAEKYVDDKVVIINAGESLQENYAKKLKKFIKGRK